MHINTFDAHSATHTCNNEKHTPFQNYVVLSSGLQIQASTAIATYLYRF